MNAERVERSIALSHSILCGFVIYGFLQIKDQPLSLQHVTLGFLILNNILGVVRWISHKEGYREIRITDLDEYIQLLFLLPCITATVWLKEGYQQELCYLWVLIPLIPLICQVTETYFDRRLIDLIVLCNLIGVGAPFLQNQNLYGLGATLVYGLAYFRAKSFIVYNYGMCVFTYLSMVALGLCPPPV